MNFLQANMLILRPEFKAELAYVVVAIVAVSVAVLLLGKRRKNKAAWRNKKSI